MNKVRFLTVSSVLLLLLNLGLILYLFYGKKNTSPPEGPRAIIIEKLQFEPPQIVQYDTLIAQHRKEIRATQQKIVQLRKSIYTLLNSPENTSEKDSLMRQVGNAQIEIEQIHYAHFEDIRALCEDNQQQKFKDLTTELTDYFITTRASKNTKK
jgi:periplasmic protein CpxP/Spy